MLRLCPCLPSDREGSRPRGRPDDSIWTSSAASRSSWRWAGTSAGARAATWCSTPSSGPAAPSAGPASTCSSCSAASCWASWSSREQARTGRFDGRRFTARRLLQLWPVLYVFLAVQALLGAEPVGSYLWQNALHVQNYAGTSLAHLWSLAVEEHFYLAAGRPLPAVRPAPRLAAPAGRDPRRRPRRLAGAAGHRRRDRASATCSCSGARTSAWTRSPPACCSPSSGCTARRRSTASPRRRWLWAAATRRRRRLPRRRRQGRRAGEHAGLHGRLRDRGRRPPPAARGGVGAARRLDHPPGGRSRAVLLRDLRLARPRGGAGARPAARPGLRVGRPVAQLAKFGAAIAVGVLATVLVERPVLRLRDRLVPSSSRPGAVAPVPLRPAPEPALQAA